MVTLNFTMNQQDKITDLPKRLKILRERNRFSQQMIAEKLKISQAKYNYFESGKYSPDIVSLKVLSELYGTTINDLLNADLDKIPKSDTFSRNYSSQAPDSAFTENSDNVRTKLIIVYEKRIIELEEKCERKDRKIVSLKSNIEKLHMDFKNYAIEM